MFVTFGDTALQLSPGAGERLETARRLDVRATGPESNAAVAARRTGAVATHATVLPDSALGRRVARDIRAHDVDLRVAWAEGRQGLTFYEPAASPRAETQVEDRGRSAFADVEQGALPLDAVQEADGAYLTGTTPGHSTAAAEAAARFLKAARDGSALTGFGLNYRPDQWTPAEAAETLTGFFPVVDVLIAEMDDVATVLDRDGEPRRVAHVLASDYDFQTVALLRDQTLLAWHGSTVYEFPVLDVDEVDATGRTAAFAGAFLARLLDGASAEAALRCGTAAHALVRTVAGPQSTFSRAELDRATAAVGTD